MKYILLPITFLLLTSCNNEVCIDCKDYLNRQFLNYYQKYGINDITNFFNLDSHYYIYLYSITCPHCENIKGCILDYIDLNKSPPMYLLQKDKIENIKSHFKELPPIEIEDKEPYINESLNKSDLKDVYYFGTPSLFEIKNNSLISYYVGEASLITLFNSLN